MQRKPVGFKSVEGWVSRPIGGVFYGNFHGRGRGFNKPIGRMLFTEERPMFEKNSSQTKSFSK